MSRDTNESGLGVFGVLFILFVVLKLTHLVDWSWWMVTSPVWVPASIFLLVVLVYFFILKNK